MVQRGFVLSTLFFIYFTVQKWNKENRSLYRALKPLFAGFDLYTKVFSTSVHLAEFKVSATLKIAIFPYLRFERFQINMLESFLFEKKSEENIISVERYRGEKIFSR